MSIKSKFPGCGMVRARGRLPDHPTGCRQENDQFQLAISENLQLEDSLRAHGDIGERIPGLHPMQIKRLLAKMEV